MFHDAANKLSIRPEDSHEFLLRLYPISLERSARLAQLASEEEYAHEGVRVAWEEERDRVEDEYRRGRERVRERLLEGIEERRRKAREEKDGEGITGALFTDKVNPSTQLYIMHRCNIGFSISPTHHTQATQ